MNLLLKETLSVDWKHMLMSGIRTVSKTKERQSRYTNSNWNAQLIDHCVIEFLSVFCITKNEQFINIPISL